MKNKKNTTNENKDSKASDFKNFLLNEIDLSGQIASHFGFSPILNVKVNKEDELKLKSLKDSDINKDEALDRIAMLRFYEESGLSKSPNPAMFYFKKQSNSKNVGVCSLEIIGTNKTLAEALVIKTTLAILEDYGHKDLSIEINCIGDKESFSKFEKDLASFIKKNIYTF